MISEYEETLAQYRLVLDYSSDPIFAFSQNGTYLYVNEAFAEGVCLPVDQIINRSIWDVFPKVEADKRFAVVKWVFESGETKVLEVRVPRPDNDRYYLTTVKPGKDTYGRVHTVICISKEITERKRMEEELLELSTRDMLTGLYNRNFFGVELERLQVSRMFPVSIVVADMDNLKAVNDRYGHVKGDELLKVVAEIFRQSFRAEDVIARLGGDEFGVLLPSTAEDPAMDAVERLRISINCQQNPLLAISIGMATSRMEEELVGVYKRADDCMYKEKMSHRMAKKP